jgi:hypothetical protein
VYVPTCIQSFPPCEHLWTCVGVVAPAGAGPAPGVVRGRGKKDGHSPPGKPGCLPMRYQVLKSILPMIIVSNVVNLHSPAGVFHAVLGSRPVLLTMGFTAYVSFVQFVCNGSVGSEGTAIAKFVPPGQLELYFATQRPGYTCTTLPSTTVADPV